MNIHGIELDFDINELQTMEKYDKGMTAVAQVNLELQENIKMSPYERISGLMEAIRKFYDLLFGEGTGERVCGLTNAKKHMEAYKELIMEKERQQKEYALLCASISEIDPVKKPTTVKVNDFPAPMSPAAVPEGAVQKMIEGAFHESDG